MFAEPAPTQFDLRFNLGTVAVRIHPFFWLGCLFLGWARFQSLGFGGLLLWTLCVFVSLMIHEMGHHFGFSDADMEALEAEAEQDEAGNNRA